jgi:hypothetical protein
MNVSTLREATTVHVHKAIILKLMTQRCVRMSMSVWCIMEDVHTNALTLKDHDIVPANQAFKYNTMIQISVKI